MSATDTIAAAIRRRTFVYANEDDLQMLVVDALDQAGADVEREYRLNERDRIDVLAVCNGGPAVEHVGVEVKVAGRQAQVLHQLSRYAESEEIDGLVLVTNRVRHRMPREINGKPVRVVCLARVV